MIILERFILERSTKNIQRNLLSNAVQKNRFRYYEVSSLIITRIRNSNATVFGFGIFLYIIHCQLDTLFVGLQHTSLRRRLFPRSTHISFRRAIF